MKRVGSGTEPKRSHSELSRFFEVPGQGLDERRLLFVRVDRSVCKWNTLFEGLLYLLLQNGTF